MRRRKVLVRHQDGSRKGSSERKSKQRRKDGLAVDSTQAFAGFLGVSTER